MLLAVHCSWEEREKMDIIQLSVQSEPQGKCTSLKEILIEKPKSPAEWLTLEVMP